MAGNKPDDIDYKTYLSLPELLSAQKPISAAHDEMLFIAVHQTYEIWFKQALFELARVQKLFSRDTVADRDLRTISAALARVNDILEHLVRQVDLLETMTPLDFLDFRHVFRSASGFQSLQFREIEIRLGLRREDRLTFGGKNYDDYLSAADRAQVRAAESDTSLFDLVDRWLARTPFVNMDGFDFWQAYREAVLRVAAQDKVPPVDPASLDWRLSPEARKAALLVMLYRDEPILQAPFAILDALMDIDETMTLWRHRHALMAQRMLGMKTGSGGSTGHDYLAQAAAKNRVFTDFFALSTFMIPRADLPRLPQAVEEKLGFRHGNT